MQGFLGASGEEREGGPEGPLETVGDGGVELREEVPVAVEVTWTLLCPRRAWMAFGWAPWAIARATAV